MISAPQIYDFIIKPIRDADEQGILKRLLQGCQLEWETLLELSLVAPKLVSPSECPSLALDYLLQHLGFGVEITSDLSELEKRRLAQVGLRLWKERGTTGGLYRAIRTLTSRDCIILRYSEMAGSVGDFVRYFPLLIEDDSVYLVQVPKSIFELARILASLSRPFGESCILQAFDIVDDFRWMAGYWDASGDVQADESVLTGSGKLYYRPSEAQEWDDYYIAIELKLLELFRVRFLKSETGWCSVSLNPVNGEVRLEWHDTDLLGFAFYEFPDDSILLQISARSSYIRVEIDGNLVLEYSDSIPETGSIELESNALWVDRLWLWLSPLQAIKLPEES